MQREPLRLWYRITPSVPSPSSSAPAVIKKEVEPEQPEPIQQQQQPRASLVDITSKRTSWELNSSADRPAKRRKRDKPAKIQRPASSVPAAEETLPDTTATDEKGSTIFDDVRSAEFSCSTPIPAGSANAPALHPEESEIGSTKLLNWLPKAVFDLDDRALFAKRLEREKVIATDSATTPGAAEEPEAPNPCVAVKSEPPHPENDEDDGNKPLDPLHICVPSDDQHPQDEKDPAEEVHDSNGALDLSGSKSDVSSSSASPHSSGSICSPRTSGPAASGSSTGPHPFFMTPSAVYQNHQPPSSSSASPSAATPLWDLMQHVQQPTSAHCSSSTSTAAAVTAQQSLFSLLFRHAAAAAAANKKKKQSSPAALPTPPAASNSSAM